MDPRIIFWFFVVYLVSLGWNWGVQLTYYYICIRANPRAFQSQRTLFDYLTGVVGDGVIVPIINILIFYVLYEASYTPTAATLLPSWTAALVLDVLAHCLQGQFKMVNWSMPRPYRWNFAGYWHMISFPFEIGYILLFFDTLIKNFDMVMANISTRYAFYGVISLMILFIVLYYIDNKKL